MAARPCAHGNDPIDPQLRALLGMAVLDHVLEHQAAIGLQLPDQIAIGGQRQHYDGHLVLEDNLQIGLKPGVTGMRDEVDGIGQVSDTRRNPRNILVQNRSRARIKRGHRANDPGAALCDHQIRGRGDEHRPGHHREAQFGAKTGRKGQTGSQVKTSAERCSG